MRYTYAYKTSDGKRHEASIDAESREKVFETLRKQGIRPIKVVAADGSKENGEIKAKSRGRFAWVVVAAAAAAITAAVLAMRGNSTVEVSSKFARALPRQMIAGDRERVEAAKKNFTDKTEAFLARFVEPGRTASAPECDWPTRKEVEVALVHPIEFTDNEFTEQIDVKRMVVWLKSEMQNYINGGGYVSGYIRELIERQNTEIGQRNEALQKLNELMKDRDNLNVAYEHWLRANAQLQGMGIYPLELPPNLSRFQ